MKKLLSNIRRKQPKEPVGRITTDTLAAHREKVLAGGRKFKYPVQYQRHRLVINAVIIAVITLILLVSIGWYLLYVAKNTSEFMYRVTKVIPVPVAFVDGQPVRYSTYLMKYRSDAYYLIEKQQIDENSPDGKSELQHVQVRALDDAIAYAYATKLAKELDVEISASEIEALYKQQRQSSDGELSEITYNSVIKDFYDWSPSEYREVMRSKLLRQKVSYAIDKNAESIANKIETMVKEGASDLSAISTTLNASSKDSVIYMAPEWVSKNNEVSGLATAAALLKKGQVSSAIKTTSGNGYHYVRLIDSNETQVQYEYIRVPLTEFNRKFNAIKSSEKLTRLITIGEDAEVEKQQ